MATLEDRLATYGLDADDDQPTRVEFTGREHILSTFQALGGLGLLLGTLGLAAVLLRNCSSAGANWRC